MNVNKNQRLAQSINEQNFTPVIFNYEGKSINFKEQKGSIMLNATQMAKVFGKTPKDWLRLQSTKEFLEVLQDGRWADMPNDEYKEENLVIVIKGGKNQGTWMHEDVALEFSRWLHPKFAIWTNRHIKELLVKGQTSINQKNKGYPSLPPKRKHNRLTPIRLLDIMVDVAQIDNAEIRLSLISKLGLC